MARVSPARFRDAFQSLQPIVMADVNQLRISSPAKARCHSGCDLFKSNNALLWADRFNVPIVVRINQRTWADRTSAPSTKTEPAWRLVFDNLTPPR